MFGFGLSKLIVLALIIGAVWYGFKFFGRLDNVRDKVEKTARKAAERVAGEPAATQDMERCETCGDFVAQGGATACGRAACPYPG